MKKYYLSIIAFLLGVVFFAAPVSADTIGTLSQWISNGSGLIYPRNNQNLQVPALATTSPNNAVLVSPSGTFYLGAGGGGGGSSTTSPFVNCAFWATSTPNTAFGTICLDDKLTTVSTTPGSDLVQNGHFTSFSDPHTPTDWVTSTLGTNFGGGGPSGPSTGGSSVFSQTSTCFNGSACFEDNTINGSAANDAWLSDISQSFTYNPALSYAGSFVAAGTNLVQGMMGPGNSICSAWSTEPLKDYLDASGTVATGNIWNAQGDDWEPLQTMFNNFGSALNCNESTTTAFQTVSWQTAPVTGDAGTTTAYFNILTLNTNDVSQNVVFTINNVDYGAVTTTVTTVTGTNQWNFNSPDVRHPITFTNPTHDASVLINETSTIFNSSTFEVNGAGVNGYAGAFIGNGVFTGTLEADQTTTIQGQLPCLANGANCQSSTELNPFHFIAVNGQSLPFDPTTIQTTTDLFVQGDSGNGILYTPNTLEIRAANPFESQINQEIGNFNILSSSGTPNANFELGPSMTAFDISNVANQPVLEVSSSFNGYGGTGIGVNQFGHNAEFYQVGTGDQILGLNIGSSNYDGGPATNLTGSSPSGFEFSYGGYGTPNLLYDVSVSTSTGNLHFHNLSHGYEFESQGKTFANLTDSGNTFTSPLYSETSTYLNAGTLMQGMNQYGDTVSVNGNAMIGSGYFNIAAPANGLGVEGDVEIGTTTAGAGNALTVAGKIFATGTTTAPCFSTDGGATCLSAGTSIWQLNGTSTYYNAGNVGIGTMTPNVPLQVIGSASFGTSTANSGKNSLAYGSSTTITGNDDFSGGEQTNAVGTDCVAIGFGSECENDQSAAIGNEVLSSGFASMAFGRDDTASGDEAFAGGYGNNATGNGSFTFGQDNTAATQYSGVAGDNNTIVGSDTFGFGRDNVTNEAFGFVQGYGNTVSSTSDGISAAFGELNTVLNGNDFAIGESNTVTGTFEFDGGIGNNDGGNNSLLYGENLSIGSSARDSAVFGYASEVNNTYDLAAGYNNHALGSVDTVLGQSGTVTSNDALLVNLNTSVQTLAQNSTMAVMGGQVGLGTVTPDQQLTVSGNEDISGNLGIGTSTPAYPLSVVGNASIGGINTVSGINNMAVGDLNSVTGTDNAAFGQDNTVNNSYDFAAGEQNTVSGNAAFAAGVNTIASGDDSVALGSGSHASGPASFAAGSSVASGQYAASFGLCTASGFESMCTGQGNTASGDFSLAFGVGDSATGSVSMAFGQNMRVGTGEDEIGFSLTSNPFTHYSLSQTSTMAIMGGNVGIGTTTPNSVLTVVGTSTLSNLILSDVLPPTSSLPAILNIITQNSSPIVFDRYGGAPPNIIFRRANGTEAAPTNVTTDNQLFAIGGRGFGSTIFSGSSRAAIFGAAAESWTDTAQGAYLAFNTTPIGTSTTAERLRITASGNVGIGTTTPSKALDVVGEIRSSATSTASCFTTDGVTCIGGISLSGTNIWSGLNTFNATTTLATTTINGELNLEWGTPTLSSCGTSPSISGNNHVGTVTIGGGISVTACTINFIPNFVSSSKCIAEGINTFTSFDVTAQSSSSVTFGLSVSLAGGQFNYQCFE